MVECFLPKEEVASSNLVHRSVIRHMKERQSNQQSVVDIFAKLLTENGIEKKEIEAPIIPTTTPNPLEIVDIEMRSRAYEEKRRSSVQKLLTDTNETLWLYGSNVKIHIYDSKYTYAYREIGKSETPAIGIDTLWGRLQVQLKGEFEKGDERMYGKFKTNPKSFTYKLINGISVSEVVLHVNEDFSIDNDKLPSLENSLRAGFALTLFKEGVEKKGIPKNPMGGYSGGYH